MIVKIVMIPIIEEVEALMFGIPPQMELTHVLTDRFSPVASREVEGLSDEMTMDTFSYWLAGRKHKLVLTHAEYIEKVWYVPHSHRINYIQHTYWVQIHGS